MSYTPRPYDAIVRDLLTTLTGGTVRETLPAPAGADELLVPVKLQERPVRRVSHLEGYVPNPAFDGQTGDDAPPELLPYRFTDADFELVAAAGDGAEPDSIRFRDEGRRPAPGTELSVNYYPVETAPVPVTDLNVGSVVRTLLETVGRELALTELRLEHVYKSAFLDTAEGRALDQVVALVGVRRLQTGHPTAVLRVTRQAGVTGQITLPANTAVTDADGNRYLLRRAVTMEPNESTRDVEARGAFPSTTLVEAGTLTRLETLVAGVGGVTNPEAAFRLTAQETDEALRRRARVALQGSVRGTPAALLEGLRAVEGVKDVALDEVNAPPGTVKVNVVYDGDPASVLPALRRRADELRPAGVRIDFGEAATRRVQVEVALTLAGTGVPAADEAALLRDAEARLDAYLAALPPGSAAGTPVRAAQMLAALLQDARIVDAAVTFVENGAPLGASLTLAEGEALEVEGYVFAAPVPEVAVESTAGTSTVHADVPFYPEPGTTAAEAREALQLAFTAYLPTLGPAAPLTVDALRTALRDDTRYGLDVAELVVTVERFDGTFRQLTLDGGSYVPVAGETFAAGTFDAHEPTG